MTTKVLCIGDVMLDVVTKIAVMPSEINYGSDTASEISTHGGGAAANVASWLTRTNVEATIVGHVGDDAAGAALISEFDALGVRHENLMVSGARSGVVVVLVDPTGERTMFPDNGANSGLHIGDLPDITGFDAVYISGYSPLDPQSLVGIKEMITKIRAANIPVYFDPASVGAMKEVDINEVKSWLPMMNVLLLNEEEAIYLTGESDLEKALDSLLISCETVVVKRGSYGAIGKKRGSDSISVLADAAMVLDTTGAGDSFAAGFISQFCVHGDLSRSLMAGAEIAAHCVAIIGARPRVGTEI
ncbi:MAG: carbohydrate kinase family protein [Actinobacteria bacterium]|nr:carbohydrate kinase family protein [Actinomycetota bacterium]